MARRATDNGVTVATGLTVQPFEESGYHVITTAEVSTNQTLFAVPVDVAVRVDSQHTDFGSVFAAELEAGWWTPEMAGAADELHVVALVLYVQVAGCAYMRAGNAVEALGVVLAHMRVNAWSDTRLDGRLMVTPGRHCARYERFYVPRSFWQPYWDICPTNFDFLPPYFSDE